MAKVDIQMPDDFLEKLSRLGSRTDAIAETVLKSGGEVVLEKVKSNLASAEPHSPAVPQENWKKPSD